MKIVPSMMCLISVLRNHCHFMLPPPVCWCVEGGDISGMVIERDTNFIFHPKHLFNYLYDAFAHAIG